MARELKKNRKPETKANKVITPSSFGSHASMIQPEETKALNDESLVVLKDEHGLYTTERSKLDTGLADPNRYVTSRLTELLRVKAEAAA